MLTLANAAVVLNHEPVAPSSVGYTRTNVLGTQGLCEAAKRVGVTRFHHVSTCEVYGDLALDTTWYLALNGGAICERSIRK